MKTRIPTLHKDDPPPTLPDPERDRELRLACRAAVRLLDDQTASAPRGGPRDEPAPLPASSRRLIRHLARQRTERLARERRG